MGTAETFPPLFSPLPSLGSNNGSQVPPGHDDLDTPIFKKPRNSDDMINPTQKQQLVSDVLPPPPVLRNPPQNNPSQSNKLTRLFFKTRLCMKFKLGSCPYGQNCSFAHGPEELRQAPPNWLSMVGRHDDERLSGTISDRQQMNKLKVCRKYYNGEVCPYGGRCTFAHVEPGSFRESSAISVGITEVTPLIARRGINGSLDLETNGLSSSYGDDNGSLRKCSFSKTKLCHKWEQMDDYPFAELKKFGGLVDVETNSVPAHSKHLPSPAETIPPHKTGQPSKQKGFVRLMGLRKIRNIYADWIEDIPPL